MFEQFLKLIKKLRRECPWDRKQTLNSSRSLILNEAYELEEAIQEKNFDKIIEELGDVIFTTLFVAQILKEKKKISFNKIVQKTVNKIVLRHPHVFGNVRVKNVKEVLANWENIKKSNEKIPILQRIPKALPALKRAQMIQERVARVGFDWENESDVYKKVLEEIKELKTAITRKNKIEIEAELGDLLFALVNFARHLNIDAEIALNKANNKFISRFTKLERQLEHKNKKLTNCTLAEMDEIWEQIKQQKNNNE